MGWIKERFWWGLFLVSLYSHWTSHAAIVNESLQWLETCYFLEMWVCGMEKHGHNSCYWNIYFLWIHWLWQPLFYPVDLEGMGHVKSQSWYIKAVFPQKMKEVICSLTDGKVCLRPQERKASLRTWLTSLGTFQKKEDLLLFFFLVGVDFLLFHCSFSLSGQVFSLLTKGEQSNPLNTLKSRPGRFCLPLNEYDSVF